LSFEQILFERDKGAAWITLNRPHARNAATETMHAEMLAALEEVRHDRSVNAVVLTGAGDRDFSIGSDVDFLTAAYGSGDFSLFRDYLERFNHLLFTLEELPVPTIAMVNGKARAGGFETIMACDIVLIAEEAMIGDVHTPYGHMPGVGATQRTARKIGFQRSLELIYTGKWLRGSEAVDYGIALRAVPRERLREETEKLVAQLADKTRESLSYIKRATYRGWDLPLRDGVALEVHSYLEYLATSRAPVEIFRENQEKRRLRKASRQDD
jgi:enoyl-CoA hydratase/carnithine racemase